MRFKDALSVLAKSSPFAVSTEKKYTNPNDPLEQIKKDLYVRMPIEQAVHDALASISSANKKVVFLCGSSGDGKSELLVRAKSLFSSRVHFHLDATHSFAPHETAIETLDRLFDQFYTGSLSLVVGINTGMLGNYAEEGNNQTFRDAIKKFLEFRESSENIQFIDFESFPKFSITADPNKKVDASFAKRILATLVRENSMLYQQYLHDAANFSDHESRRIRANYQLLCLDEVRDTIVDLLFKARLVRDQFLTARALLDLVYVLLTGKNYLFDNLFRGGDNELLDKIASFDPATKRTKALDRFIMAFNLDLPMPDFTCWRTECESKFGIIDIVDEYDRKLNAYSFIRLFFTLKYLDFCNNFHQQFSNDYTDNLMNKYLDVYQLHRFYDDSIVKKNDLQKFYTNTLISALRRYINRNAPKLSNKQYLISRFADYQIAAQLNIKPDLDEIKNKNSHSLNAFIVRLRVGEERVSFEVNINLLNLLHQINAGYRPNKHDRSAVVVLDEIAGRISAAARASAELIFNKVSNGQVIEQFKFESDGDQIAVEVEEV